MKFVFQITIKKMKAAVLHQLGSAPRYEDFPDPKPANDEELLLTIKAASIKNLDRGRASGQHYASHTNLPEVVGMDGVGLLQDGTRVYATGITGMIAEKALTSAHRYIPVPNGVDDATAAALPNAVLGSAVALRYKAQLQPGQTILINGATGVTGKVAIQIAKHYGASYIIATGRNPKQLAKLSALGANEVISLKQDDKDLLAQLKTINEQHPIDVVLDYTWGKPIKLIIQSLKGGGMHHISRKVRIVTVGSMAGEDISLSSGTLRSSAIELLGSGIGSILPEEMHEYRVSILPEMFQLAADGKLNIDTDTVLLKDVEQAWLTHNNPGSRLVVMMHN